MCIITGLTVGLGMGITSALGMTAASATTAMVAGAIGTTMIAGAVAGVTAIGANMYQSARISKEMQKQQAEQIKKLQENQGELDVAKVNNSLQDNSRKPRTLSSLRIGLVPQEQNKEDITRNVYGVDTNQVATSTQNMVGLNIAVA